MADLLVFYLCGVLLCPFACSGSQKNAINFVSDETNWFDAYSSCYLKMRGKFITLEDAEIELYNSSLLRKIHRSGKKLWDPYVTLRTKIIITKGCFKVENLTELINNRGDAKSLQNNALTSCYHQCMYNTSSMPVAIAMQNLTCLCLTTSPNYESMDQGPCTIHCPDDRNGYCGAHGSIFSLYEIDNSTYPLKSQSSDAGCGYVSEERSQTLSIGNCGLTKWFYCTKSSKDDTYVSKSGDTWDNSGEQCLGHLAHIDDITNVYRNDVELNYNDGFWVGHRIWSYYYQYTGSSSEPNVTAIMNCRYTESASNVASFGPCLNSYSYLCLQPSSSISTSLSPPPSEGRPIVTDGGGGSKDLTTPFRRANGFPNSPSESNKLSKKSYGLIIGLIGAIAAVLAIMIFAFVRKRRTKYDVTYHNEEHHEMEIIATRKDSCNSTMNSCDGTEQNLHTHIGKAEQSSNTHHTKCNCEQNSDYDHALLNTQTNPAEEGCNIYHTKRNCEQNSDYDHALLNAHTNPAEEGCNIFHTNRNFEQNSDYDHALLNAHNPAEESFNIFHTNHNFEQNSDYDHALLNAHTNPAEESFNIFHTNRNCERNDYYDHVKQNSDMTSAEENSNYYRISSCVQNNAYDQTQTSSDD